MLNSIFPENCSPSEQFDSEAVKRGKMQSHNIAQKHEAGKLKLKKLTPYLIGEIDEYLASIGDYGEIRLIVQNGELRYINCMASHKACMTATWQERDAGKLK
jgi:hypothetical protein